MSNEKKRPSIEQFKQFVKEHPKLRDEVKSGNKTWQQFFEEWYLHGEESDIWDSYRENSKSKKSKNKETKDEGYVGKVMSFMRNLDPNEIEGHLSSVNSTLTNIQNLISQFKSPASSNQREQKQSSQPFHFRQD